MFTLNVDLYRFESEEEFYNLTNLFKATEKRKVGDFKLIDWVENGDVIYTLFDYSLSLRGYETKTYVVNTNDVVPKPQLIEYCKVEIAAGTAERGFDFCKRFEVDTQSLYLNQKDLP